MGGDEDDEQMKKEEEEQGDRHKSSSWRECGESPSTSLSSSTTHPSLLAIRTQALAQTQYHPEVHRVLCNSLDQSTVVSAKELVSRSTWHFYLSYLMWS